MVNSGGVTLRQAVLLADETQKQKLYFTFASNIGVWMSLAQLSALTGIVSESSIASRIRDLRRCGLNIERRKHPNSNGATRVFEYRFRS
jgi:biotin operon repressor